jgi:hypothetical protein
MTPAISSAVKYTLVAALAAAGMYWFDPDRGRRRRALMRGKIARSLKGIRLTAGVTGDDARYRMHRAVPRAYSLIRANDVSDDVLVERVRVAMGRTTTHPQEIEVSCSHGIVTLRGVVLKHEHPRVMRAARSAAGLGEVHDELAAYKRPIGAAVRNI